ncbi:DUF4468 domain-containing protein [Spirosoma spitsbergense]|uniref:DUF4468 domain-containing protein n=1 Tax=Spirosoma spitsbergense TaxID=431554 RepID=UPI0003634B54|nr:DUF4468 domain-containing protein [Spirosoma spitsbergense]
MKNQLLYLLLLILPLSSLAQKTFVQDGKLNGVLPINESGRVVYQIIEPVEGVSKEEIFKRARKWLIDTYTSPKNGLQLNDPGTGELSSKETFSINPSIMGIAVPTQVSHSITIDVKDGKYRVLVSNFYVVANTIQGPIEALKNTTKGFVTSIFKLTDSHVMELLTSLNKATHTDTADF